MKEFKDITELVKYLTMYHREILHSKSKKHFVSQADEMSTSVDSVLHYPAVFLYNQGYRITGEPGGYSMNTTFSLSVLEHVTDTGDYVQIGQVLEKTNRILLELLNLLVLLRRKYPKVLAGFSLTNVEIEPVDNASNSLYGQMAMIRIMNPYNAVNCEDVLQGDHNLY